MPASTSASVLQALFQHSLDEVDADLVGDAVGEAAPWLARADARMLVRRAYGVLVEGLTEPHARALAQALATRGVDVERVDQAWLELPPVTACRRAELGARALVIYDPYGRALELPWSRVLLVAVGSYPVPERVPHSRKPFEPAPGRRDPWGMRTLLGEDVSLGQSSYEYVDRAQVVLDIVADVPARYRIQNQRFDYSYLGERRGPSAATNFPLLIKDLLERVPHAIQTRGMRLARGDAGEMLSYPSPTQYEREIAWSLWRFLGPGTRLDGGDPYRSSGAVGPRLTMPLMLRPASRSSTSSPARSPGQRTTSALTRPGATLADAGLAVLGGVAVGVAGWWIDPLAALLAWPVARALLQRLHRRRRQRMDTPEAPAADAPEGATGNATPDRDPEP